MHCVVQLLQKPGGLKVEPYLSKLSNIGQTPAPFDQPVGHRADERSHEHHGYVGYEGQQTAGLHIQP